MNDVANELKEILLRLDRLEEEVRKLKNEGVATPDWPAGVLLTPSRRKALDALRREGYLRISAEGNVMWCGSSVTTLAFVCGRLWSGDRVVRGRWRKGSAEFPAKSLEQYFGVKGLRNKREIRLETYLSDEESGIYEILTHI